MLFKSWNHFPFRAEIDICLLWTLSCLHCYSQQRWLTGLETPTYTLVRLAELVLNLTSFEFDSSYYQQTGGVAMGTKMGPNYACLFVGYVERKMFEDYQDKTPDLYKHYIDDQSINPLLTWSARLAKKLVYRCATK